MRELYSRTTQVMRIHRFHTKLAQLRRKRPWQVSGRHMHLKELYAQDKEHDAENPWTFKESTDLVRALSDSFQDLSSRRKKDLTVSAKNFASDRKKTIAGAEEDVEKQIPKERLWSIVLPRIHPFTSHPSAST